MPTPYIDTFPPDGRIATQGYGFTNNADALQVSSLLTEDFMKAAEKFSMAAVTNLSTLLPCDPVAVGNDVCAKQFISNFGLRAFRRPLTVAESARFFGLYTAGVAAPLMMVGTPFANGIELAIEGFLESPNFLYRVERGVPASPADAVAPLGQYEMAARLSYFFWGTTPNKSLLDAAQAGLLGTAAQVEAQTQQMLKDPRAKVAVSNFHNEWLNLAGIPYLNKDPAMFKEWTPAIGMDLFNETQAFLDYVFWQDGKSDTLFGATYSFVNDELATFYGVPPPGSQNMTLVNLNPAQRAGVLTLGGILASNAKVNQTSPVIRGKFVREQLLCQDVPPPPPNLVITPPTVTAGVTTRERYAQHEIDPMCASCHKLMDGMGVGFEHYDPLGRWRDVDQGKTIDDTGDVIATTDMNGAFHGVVELAGKFAKSADVRQCVVKQWFRYANGRGEDPVVDKCTLERLNKNFEDSGHDMRDLRVKIATSDAFRYRSMQGGGQ